MNPLSLEARPNPAVEAVIGLISDTHASDRLFELPAALPEVFQSVDLILHAGDVGDGWVLERLSDIAPVVAVHGNDELSGAPAYLPEKQTIAVCGRRIALFHGHYPDRAEEMASRQMDDLPSKLDRLAEMTRGAGARISVFGHWHIPMVVQRDGVLLINPGALASRSHIMRQAYQTVALLALLRKGETRVVHVDLAQPDRALNVEHDLAQRFNALARQFNTPILEPRLQGRVNEFRALAESFEEIFLPLWRRAAQPCWAGHKDYVAVEDLLTELRSEEAVPPDLLARLTEVLE